MKPTLLDSYVALMRLPEIPLSFSPSIQTPDTMKSAKSVLRHFEDVLAGVREQKPCSPYSISGLVDPTLACVIRAHLGYSRAMHIACSFARFHKFLGSLATAHLRLVRRAAKA